MFEDSMMESGNKIKSKSKYWMIATFAINAAILFAMILVPLLDPEALPKSTLTASLTAPPPPPPPPPAPAVKAVAHVVEDAGFHAPTKIPKDIDREKEDAPPPAPSMTGGVMGGMAGGAPGGVFGGVMGGAGSGPAVSVTPAKPKGPARISGGVIAGTRTTFVQPTYPPIAKVAHMSGQVVLRAIIAKNGTIQQLSVASSSNPMFNNYALEAVKQWRYKPYVLNGEPTEVDTTITVNFSLNGGG